MLNFLTLDFFERYEYHVTNKKDLSLEAFEKWLEGKSENAPMSEIEIELNNAQKEQNSLMPSAVASQTLKGNGFLLKIFFISITEKPEILA